jgi:hypothetical protein
VGFVYFSMVNVGVANLVWWRRWRSCNSGVNLMVEVLVPRWWRWLGLVLLTLQEMAWFSEGQKG